MERLTVNAALATLAREKGAEFVTRAFFYGPEGGERDSGAVAAG